MNPSRKRVGYKTVGLLIAVVAAMPLAAVHAETAERWLHVRVQDGNDANVAVNLPLTAVAAAAELVPAEVRRMEIDSTDFSVSDLRTMWNELRAYPNEELVKVDEPDQKVVVSLVDDYLRVTVSGTENVRLRIPASVVDALLSGEGNELAIGAALETLSESGSQELVTVEGDENVRIWIDASASGEDAS